MESLRQVSVMAIADLRSMEAKRDALADREYELYYKGYYDDEPN